MGYDVVRRCQPTEGPALSPGEKNVEIPESDAQIFLKVGAIKPHEPKKE